jgi:dephospho-CoA kinase
MALKPVIIGLTGGIGSGKTYVAGIFRGLGARIIDADKIAHQVIDHPAVRSTLIKWYSRDILDKNGRIIRRKVAQAAFVGVKELRRLNRLTHPYIRKEMLSQIKGAREAAVESRLFRGGSVIVIDAPLLLESKLDKLCDYVVFILTPEKLRLKRIMATRDWDITELRKRARHQMSLSGKKSMADFVIDNKSSATALAHTKRIFGIISKPR